MNQKELDERYMRRCLQLAVNGKYQTRPNPMVGAVIVYDDRIIGEGYHIRCGEAHAEVNAFASVKPEDEQYLKDATIYVSLEPCAHYGKTPPCCDLIIRKGVKRCVVGCVDPFAKVQGRGLQRIRDAGIEVTVGVLEEECKQLNKFFITYHQYHRPYILLKWAQTNNGFLDDDGKALAISSPYTKMLVHQLRSEYDAIVVGRITDEREHPLLNVREWSGPSPYRYVLSHDNGIDQILNECYERQQQSLIVEGGRQTLQSFLDRGLWDEIRVETAPITIEKGTPAPLLPGDVSLVKEERYDGCIIRWYKDLA